MSYIEIATVTYFTNVPKGHWPSDEEAEFVAAQVVAEFEKKLRESPLAADLVVLRADYDIACIVTTITLGATLAGIYKFIKDYKKFRPGLILLMKDLDGIRIQLKGLVERGLTCIFDDDTPSKEKLEALAEKAEAGQIPSAQVTRQLTRRSRQTSRKRDAPEL